MKIHKLLKKIFGSAKQELYTKLFSILSLVASEKDYLENLTIHSDAIHWHLNRLDVNTFEQYLQDYFLGFLKYLRKQVSWQKITVAFDETFIPFYGKIQDNWVNGYTNKIKGAKGTYKFMVCSIIVNKKRFILNIMPMHNCQDTNKTVYEMLSVIKKCFSVETVLFDRGFCNKKLCRDLENQDLKYLILTPRWSNISKYLSEGKLEVKQLTKIVDYKTTNKYVWRFVFAYKQYGYDWAFATNMQMKPNDLVKLYKLRWGIETNFRIMDLADIKSKSKNIVTRCFFFLISAILFNKWLELNKKITFETYLDQIALANTKLKELINKWEKAKNNLGITITNKEKKILQSSFQTIISKYHSIKQYSNSKNQLNIKNKFISKETNIQNQITV